MNGKGSSSSSGGSFNNFNFDFGIGTNRSRSLNDQKNQTFSSSNPSPQRPVYQPGKPSWTHQPASSQSNLAGLNGPASMVGDIFGKSWGSSAGSGTGSGIVEKNPNLFGDLVSSALGSGKGGRSNAPLNDVKTTAGRGNGPPSFVTGIASQPKAGNSYQSAGFQQRTGNQTGFNPAGYNGGGVGGIGDPNGTAKSSMTGVDGAKSGNKDPFGSLVDFESKPKPISNPETKTKEVLINDNSFGDVFQNASRSMGSDSNVNGPRIPSAGFNSQNQQPPAQTKKVDQLDSLFPTSSIGVTSASSPEVADDWGSGFGGAEEVATTTDLDGLPPLPAGVSASAAKNKGLEHKNQGQYADAIKWLSWAVLLLEKTSDKPSTAEALSCRASCYKEVGEYKKAVADCSKVLETDGGNVSVLVQRALLYESMEKYKLGAEDLRAVLRVDPANRIAKSTIHRLNKMV